MHKQNKKMLALLAITIVFLMSCYLPTLGDLQVKKVPTDKENGLLANNGQTMSTIGTFACDEKTANSMLLAIVNAKPVGVRIREYPNGKELAIVPDGEKVFVLPIKDVEDWYYIAWKSDNGWICGYTAKRFLEIANTF